MSIDDYYRMKYGGNLPPYRKSCSSGKFWADEYVSEKWYLTPDSTSTINHGEPAWWVNVYKASQVTGKPTLDAIINGNRLQLTGYR